MHLRPAYRDQVGSYDLMQARTHEGRAFRLLTMLAEYSRECLALAVARRLTSEDVLDQLTRLFGQRRIPDYIRCDNGAEFTAKTGRQWRDNWGVKRLHIEPGSPGEKGYLECFSGKLRDELLNIESFDTLREAQVLTERWRKHYHPLRPHSALNYRPPAPEAVQPWPPGSAVPHLPALAVGTVGLT